jgi:hypothetical protein
VSQSLVMVWNNNMKPDQSEKRWIFLFNDLLVEAKPTNRIGQDGAEEAKFRHSYHLARLHPMSLDEGK